MPTSKRRLLSDEDRALDALPKRIARVVVEALPKRLGGEDLSDAEAKALERFDAEYDQVSRWRHYSSVPIEHYRRLAGARQARTIRQQASLLGLPVAGKEIDLGSFLSTLHDRLAEQLQGGKAKQNGQADDREIEKTRRVNREIAELKLAEAKRDLIPRDEVRTSLRKLARRLRDLGDDLQRTCGSEAYELLDDCLVEFSREITTAFGAETSSRKTRPRSSKGKDE